jgi:hypothetical protein
MEFIIGLIMAVRSLTFLTSFMGPQESPVLFSQPQIILSQKEIRMNLVLENSLTEDLKKLSETGTIVPMFVFIELRVEGHKEAKAKTTLKSEIVFDILNRRYVVVKSTSHDSTFFSALDSAALDFGVFRNVPVSDLDIIDIRANYFFSIYAVLGETRVEALDNKPLDLMYYWDYKRPLVRTEPISGKRFFIQKEKTP